MTHEHTFIPVEWKEIKLEFKTIKKVVKIMCQNCTQFRIIQDENLNDKS